VHVGRASGVRTLRALTREGCVRRGRASGSGWGQRLRVGASSGRLARWFAGGIVAAGLAATALVTVAGATTTATAAAHKPVLTVAEPSGPASLDPGAGNFFDDYLIGGLVYPGPMYFDPYNPKKSRLALATSWRLYNHNKTFRFTLRHNARFSDGQLVTAAAVKKYLHYVAHNKTDAAAGATYGGTIKSVRTIGKWTVVATVKSPAPHLDYAFANSGDGYGTFASSKCVAHPALLKKQTCGAGPYMIDPAKTVVGSRYTLVPNPYYYDKAQQHWSKIVFLVIPSLPSELQALETGEIQVMDGDQTTNSPAKAKGFATYTPATENTGLYLSIKGSSAAAPLKSLKVREAMNYAINRKALASAFGGTPIDEINTTDGLSKKYANYYPYNPTKAKQLLAAAGYAKGFTLDALSYGPYGSQGTPQVQGVASQLAKVGITLNITPTTSATTWSPLFNKYPAVAQCPCGLDYTSVYYQIFFGAYFPNHGYSGISDPKLAAMWRKANSAPPAQAAKEWKNVWGRTVKQAYFVPTLIHPLYFAYNAKKVKDIASTAWGHYMMPAFWQPVK
jgi:peptide/nickel transport system substrate-binding protein